MKRSYLGLALLAVFNLNSNLQAALLTIDTVTVGDAGNAADTTTEFGAVADVFAIGKYEVTISQYTTFLTSVASVTSDSYIVNLWNASMAGDLSIAGISRGGSGTLASPYSYSVIGSGNRPIAYVSWFDAARFANWVNNGAINGASTETGAYTLNGATIGVDFPVNPGATWFLPSEDQWYKAAYYKGGGTNAAYWLYPTKSDTIAGNTIGVAASANYFDGNYAQQQNGLPSFLTDAGAYGSNSASAYDTYDQGGNVWEWNDLAIVGLRGFRGGGWESNTDVALQSSFRNGADPSDEYSSLGFRVASVAATPIPESGTWAAAALLAGGAAFVRWRRRKATL